MSNWNFLLQKKGDRQWGTASKPVLKLKAGEYRLAAKGAVSADVAVTIDFETPAPTGETLQKTQTRVKRTNARGLLAIIPFTTLKPGYWTISCQSIDPDNIWEETLRLQILGAEKLKPQSFKPLPLPPNPNLFSFEGSLSLDQAAEQAEVGDTEESVLDRSLAKLMAAKGDASSESLRAMVETTFQDMEETTETPDELEDWSDQEATSDLLQSSLQELDELLREELEPVWQEMEQTAQQQTGSTQDDSPAIEPPPVASAPFVAIDLMQAVYTWSGDRPVLVRGNLSERAAVPDAYQNEMAALKLRFTLRNPQTSAELLVQEQQVSAVHLPESFRQELIVDPQWQTLAIVGKIVLETVEAIPTVLATQSFNLIADYQAIAASVKLPEPPPEDEALIDETAITLDAPIAGSSPIIAETVPTEPQAPSILPPKLHQQTSSEPHTPELPAFMQPPAAEPENPVGEAVLEDSLLSSTDHDPAASEMLALPGGDEPVAFETVTAEATTNADVPSSDAEIPYPFVLKEETAETSTPELETETTADLDWNSRFFTRLNNLAAETEDSTWLAEEPEPEPELKNPSQPEEASANPDTTTDKGEETVAIFNKDVIPATEAIADPSIEAAAEIITPQESLRSRRQRVEIVVDSLWDEQAAEAEVEPKIEPIYDASGLPYPKEFLESSAAANNDNFDIEVPVPEPKLELSKAEYQAEEMAVVRVVLSPYPDRLYVKLWMQDRQTRNLLVGPYQLTDFSLNREGNTETLMQMQIPPGSTEVRFEAIAINPRQQIESRKVGVDRRVVPKHVSEINWDDLGV
ncbi:MAG: hypothetical protein WBB82_17320 [Limnothrix sp.]